MFYSDDPVRDFENHDRQQAKQLSGLPVCVDCGESIQDDYCYKQNDGTYVCPWCNEMFHKKDVRDCV